jgi:hypothetical protein
MAAKLPQDYSSIKDLLDSYINTFEKMAVSYGGCLNQDNPFVLFLKSIKDNTVRRAMREHFVFEDLIKFESYARNRLDKSIINFTIRQMKAGRFPDKKIYVMTDCEDIDANWLLIKENDISQIKNSKDCLVFVAYNDDTKACEIIEQLQSKNIKYMGGDQTLPMAHYYHTDQIAYDTLLDEYQNNKKPHFCYVDFENIFQAINMTKDLEGDFVEIGTYQGASARAALNYMKRAGIRRESYFFDTYEGFTYAEAQESLDAIWHDTHKETSVSAVQSYLAEHQNVHVVKSNIMTDSLPDSIKRIVVCNIDVDIYDAIVVALEKVKDLVVTGGVIIAEDYGHTPCLIGAQKAVREFLKKHPNMFYCVYLPSGQLFMIKK